jgi:hypothetical protein
VDADIGGDAGQNQIFDAALVEDQFEIGGAETPFTGLVDDRLACPPSAPMSQI